MHTASWLRNVVLYCMKKITCIQTIDRAPLTLLILQPHDHVQHFQRYDRAGRIQVATERFLGIGARTLTARRSRAFVFDTQASLSEVRSSMSSMMSNTPQKSSPRPIFTKRTLRLTANHPSSPIPYSTLLQIDTRSKNDMSQHIPQLPPIFSRASAIGRKDVWMSLYGAGNGRLSIANRNNPQQVACSEATIQRYVDYLTDDAGRKRDAGKSKFYSGGLRPVRG